MASFFLRLLVAFDFLDSLSSFGSFDCLVSFSTLSAFLNSPSWAVATGCSASDGVTTGVFCSVVGLESADSLFVFFVFSLVVLAAALPGALSFLADVRVRFALSSFRSVLLFAEFAFLLAPAMACSSRI